VLVVVIGGDSAAILAVDLVLMMELKSSFCWIERCLPPIEAEFYWIKRIIAFENCCLGLVKKQEKHWLHGQKTKKDAEKGSWRQCQPISQSAYNLKGNWWVYKTWLTIKQKVNIWKTEKVPER
jgi:hypothetical protein